MEEINEEAQEAEKPTSPLDKAETLLKELQDENKRHEENLNREEALRAKKMLEGNADAGSSGTQKKETPEEMAERIEDGDWNPLFE